jgi:hypothetical protein
MSEHSDDRIDFIDEILIQARDLTPDEEDVRQAMSNLKRRFAARPELSASIAHETCETVSTRSKKLYCRPYLQMLRWSIAAAAVILLGIVGVGSWKAWTSSRQDMQLTSKPAEQQTSEQPTGVVDADSKRGHSPKTYASKRTSRKTRNGEAASPEEFPGAEKALFQTLYPDRITNEELERMDWEEVNALWTADMVPDLHECLFDPSYAAYWPTLARIIAEVSQDPASIPLLLDHIRRPFSVEVDPKRAYHLVYARLSLIKALEAIDDKAAAEPLRNLLTEEGANDLLEVWLNDPSLPDKEKRPDNLMGLIRGRAAMALVFLGDEEGIAMAEGVHAEELGSSISWPTRWASVTGLLR